jgi:hypothetical protein
MAVILKTYKSKKGRNNYMYQPPRKIYHVERKTNTKESNEKWKEAKEIFFKCVYIAFFIFLIKNK